MTRTHPLGGHIIEVAAADHLAAVEARLAEVTAERDRLRDAIEAISRHHICGCHRGHCFDCASPWPCPTEQAHIAAEATA